MTRPEITYYYDALCGWCFGFSTVMSPIYTKYREVVDFNVVSGGLFTRERVGLINDVAPYIKAGAYKSVEERTGVKFGDKFLNHSLQNNSMFMDSVPPAIALCVVKESYPESAMDFASKLLKVFYIDGMSSDDLDGYSVCAEDIGLNVIDFNSKMADPKYKRMAHEEFAICVSQEVRGFPSIVLKAGDNKVVLSNGFMDFDTLDAKISELIDQVSTN